MVFVQSPHNTDSLGVVTRYAKLAPTKRAMNDKGSPLLRGRVYARQFWGYVYQLKVVGWVITVSFRGVHMAIVICSIGIARRSLVSG